MEKKKPEEKRTRTYVEHVFELVQQKPDLVDIIILNKCGNPVKTTMDSNMTFQYAGLYGILLEKVQMSLQRIDPKDEVMMLRVRTRAHETLITPDGQITVMVVQNPQDKIQM